MAFLQQAAGTLLGGVYDTPLGQYGSGFATPQTAGALSAFQRTLRQIEADIRQKTALGKRTQYTTLLPSLIPQSVNI